MDWYRQHSAIYNAVRPSIESSITPRCSPPHPITTVCTGQSILYFADVCAGPGGFTEYLLWRRCAAANVIGPKRRSEQQDEPSAPTPPQRRRPCLTAKGFGLTLTGKCDFRETDMLAGPSEAFLAHYGPTKDGDITKWANLASFSALIDRSTDREGVHIVVADGVRIGHTHTYTYLPRTYTVCMHTYIHSNQYLSLLKCTMFLQGFDVSGQENLQEVLSKQLYICECVCALMILRPGKCCESFSTALLLLSMVKHLRNHWRPLHHLRSRFIL